MITLRDFLTEQQIKRAIRIWNTDRSFFHSRVLAEIVEPAMPEINRRLGQENVPGYIVYLIEYIFTESQR